MDTYYKSEIYEGGGKSKKEKKKDVKFFKP
jgi:hypothetical protein